MNHLPSETNFQKSENKIKAFSDIQRIKEFATYRPLCPPLKEPLKTKPEQKTKIELQRNIRNNGLKRELGFHLHIKINILYKIIIK